MDESGQRAESALFQVAHMRDGRIVELDDYRTRKRALKAAKSSRS
jgi:ketosteroid isomerase-like protein